MPSSRLRAHPSPPLRADFRPPGDKSISHRALILGALATEDTHVDGLLGSDDVRATMRAVRALGVTVDRMGEDAWRVRGAGRLAQPRAPIDCGNAGTAARLLLGAVAGHPIRVTLTGDASLTRRPMARVTAPLERMGARFAPNRGTLPLTIAGGGLTGIDYRAAVPSAQVKSAVLIAGLGTDDPVSVLEPVPTRDHGERMLAVMGVEVETVDEPNGRRLRLGRERRLRGASFQVPADPSSAAFLLAAALAVPGSDVVARGVLDNPHRSGFLRVLDAMGADLAAEPEGIAGGERVQSLRARTSRLSGTDVPAAWAPSTIDEYPILAVLAAFAEGATTMRGVGELRHKESDRLHRIVAGLRACGVEVEEGPDSLAVHGRGEAPRGGAFVETGGDHRIAMSFLILGLGAREPVTVDGGDMIATSYPDFAEQLAAAGAIVERA